MIVLRNDAPQLQVDGTEASRLGISFFGMTGEPTSKSIDSLADIFNAFESQYRSTVDACLGPKLLLGVCTIYNGCFPDKSYQRIASLALAIFNDVIIRVAIEQGLSVIDSRLTLVDWGRENCHGNRGVGDGAIRTSARNANTRYSGGTFNSNDVKTDWVLQNVQQLAPRIHTTK